MLEVKFVTDLCVFEVNIDILNVYNLGALVPFVAVRLLMILGIITFCLKI